MLSAAEIEARKASIAAQIAKAKSALGGDLAARLAAAKQAPKPQDFTLRVNAAGQAVDASGNVLKEEGPVRTMKVGVSE